MIRIYSKSVVNRRQENQDRCSFMQLMTADGTSMWCVVVADGMGGEQCGERYAELAIAEAMRFAADIVCSSGFQMIAKPALTSERALLLQTESAVKDMMNSINSAVCAKAEAQGILKGGSTLSVCMICGDGMYYANAGDSPIYMLREARATELSIRDNNAEYMVRQHQMTRESPEYEVESSALRSFIGKRGDIETHSGHVRLRPGDIVVLGSDGAFGNTNCAEKLGALLAPVRSTSLICSHLFKSAAAETGDNQTAVVVECYDGNQPGRARTVERLVDRLLGEHTYDRSE